MQADLCKINQICLRNLEKNRKRKMSKKGENNIDLFSILLYNKTTRILKRDKKSQNIRLIFILR